MPAAFPRFYRDPERELSALRYAILLPLPTISSKAKREADINRVDHLRRRTGRREEAVEEKEFVSERRSSVSSVSRSDFPFPRGVRPLRWLPIRSHASTTNCMSDQSISLPLPPFIPGHRTPNPLSLRPSPTAHRSRRYSSPHPDVVVAPRLTHRCSAVR